MRVMDAVFCQMMREKNKPIPNGIKTIFICIDIRSNAVKYSK